MENGKDLALVINDEDIKKSLNMDITKDDFVTLRVSIEEEKLEAEMKDLEAQEKKIRESLDGLNKSFEKLVQELADSKYREDVDLVNATFKKIGLKRKLELMCALVTRKDKPLVKVNIIDSKDDDEGNYRNSYGFNAELGEIPYTSEMKDNRKETEETEKEVTELLDTMSEVRIRLNNMDRIERKAKAEVTKQLIANNPKLKALMGNGNGKDK